MCSNKVVCYKIPSYRPTVVLKKAKPWHEMEKPTRGDKQDNVAQESIKCMTEVVIKFSRMLKVSTGRPLLLPAHTDTYSLPCSISA